MNDIQPTPGDYRPEDWGTVIEAAHEVTSAMDDIVHHRMADDQWHPWAAPGDTPALGRELREILDQLEQPIKAARAELARVEGAARLRAMARNRRELRAANTTITDPTHSHPEGP